MSQHTLYIEMKPVPEILERVLRAVRHRGFSVRQMQMHHVGRKASMAVMVDSDRPVELLTRQLGKLYDVENCRLAMPQAGVASN